MTGRTTPRWIRVYGNGYNLSGYTRTIGPLTWTYDEAEGTCLSDAAKGYLPDGVLITPGTLNGVLDNTATSGLHALAKGANTVWDLMVSIGSRAVPTMGDPAFICKAIQNAYHAEGGGGFATVSIPFGAWDTNDPQTLNRVPWGILLNADTARTAANTSNGTDSGVITTDLGGYLAYQITAYGGTGTTLLKVQDCDTVGGTYTDITGATTGAIAHTSMPCAGIVELSATQTVRQFWRWQLVFVTMTSLTFSLAFCRGR